VRVHHIALRTADIAGLAAFYRDIVGLSVADGAETRRSHGVWLSLGETWVMIEAREPGEPGVLPGTMDLIAFAILPSERASFEAKLGRAGVAIEGHTTFTLYFRDPDGRRLGVSHYPSSPDLPGEPSPPA
jgi:glyoxylase I family protein